MKRKVTMNTRPAKGDLKVMNGLKFVFDGHCWTLNEILYNNIDRFHNYKRRN